MVTRIAEGVEGLGRAVVFSDSQSALHLCKNLVFHEKTKHVNVRYHFIMEKMAEGEVEVEKISTNDNCRHGNKSFTTEQIQVLP